MNSVILSDVISKLKEEIRCLRNEIVILLQEKTDLEEVQSPALKALYSEKIGDLENRIRYQELMVEELKFRIMLLQAALNRAETVSEEEVDEKVDEQYRDYHQRMDEEFRKAEETKQQQRETEEERQKNEQAYQKAHTGEGSEKADSFRQASADHTETISSGTDPKGLTDGKTSTDEFDGLSIEQKIRELYRRIVKKLHPDMNPDITDHEKELWNRTQKAYREGDLETLEKIYEEIMLCPGNAENTVDEEDSLEKLTELRDRLIKQKQDICREIEQIRNAFPFTEKEFLENEAAVTEKRSQLQAIIESYEKIILELGERINRLQEELSRQ